MLHSTRNPGSHNVALLALQNNVRRRLMFPTVCLLVNTIRSLKRTMHELVLGLSLAALIRPAIGQGTLGLADGFLNFSTSTFTMQLVKDSQTLYSLSPAGSTFDFIPTDMCVRRLTLVRPAFMLAAG